MLCSSLLFLVRHNGSFLQQLSSNSMSRSSLWWLSGISRTPWVFGSEELSPAPSGASWQHPPRISAVAKSGASFCSVSSALSLIPGTSQMAQGVTNTQAVLRAKGAEPWRTGSQTLRESTERADPLKTQPILQITNCSEKKKSSRSCDRQCLLAASWPRTHCTHLLHLSLQYHTTALLHSTQVLLLFRSCESCWPLQHLITSLPKRFYLCVGQSIIFPFSVTFTNVIPCLLFSRTVSSLFLQFNHSYWLSLCWSTESGLSFRDFSILKFPIMWLLLLKE